MCSLKYQISKFSHKIHFPILEPVLGWHHKYMPGKVIVSQSEHHLLAKSRCILASNPSPGTFEAGNPLGLQLLGEQDLGGTSCCP